MQLGVQFALWIVYLFLERVSIRFMAIYLIKYLKNNHAEGKVSKTIYVKK